jgi:hypothetical protein
MWPRVRIAAICSQYVAPVALDGSIANGLITAYAGLQQALIHSPIWALDLSTQEQELVATWTPAAAYSTRHFLPVWKQYSNRRTIQAVVLSCDFLSTHSESSKVCHAMKSRWFCGFTHMAHKSNGVAEYYLQT